MDLVVEGGIGGVAARGRVEGEPADAAGERSVVAAAAAGVGERLVGLLDLDEAAGVLLGGVGRGYVRVVLARHPPVRRPHVLEAAPLRRDPQQLVERRLRLRRRAHAPTGRRGRRPRAHRRAAGWGPDGEGGRGGSGEVGHVGLLCVAVALGFGSDLPAQLLALVVQLVADCRRKASIFYLWNEVEKIIRQRVPFRYCDWLECFMSFVLVECTLAPLSGANQILVLWNSCSM